MNVVGYLGKRNVEENGVKRTVQSMQFVRQGRYYAKDRWHALGEFVDRPTLPKVEGLIEARRKLLLEQKKNTSGTQPSATPAPRRRRRTPSTTTQGK
jgi:hypothetical protein